MKSLLLVAIGGVAGTLVRFGLSVVIPDDRTGTLAANLLGVALASALLVLMERRGVTELRHLLLPGFCAGMTTFSAVTIEVVGEDAMGVGYLALTVVASLITIAVVIPFARATIKVTQ